MLTVLLLTAVTNSKQQNNSNKFVEHGFFILKWPFNTKYLLNSIIKSVALELFPDSNTTLPFLKPLSILATVATWLMLFF